MFGLNIHLQSLQLNDKLVHPNDKIRVSITTLPEKNKEAIIIESKNLKDINQFFSININENTEKILFTIRQKNYIQGDPIIGSVVLGRNLIPKSAFDLKNTEIKHIKLYSKLETANYNNEMTIQMSAENAFPSKHHENNKNNKTNKQRNGYCYSKVNSTNHNNKFEQYDNFLLVDNIN